jgi:hypothetical protein
MKFGRSQRLTTALLLYSLVLLSTFACALGHGQSTGLWLSGVGELACQTGEGGTLPSPGLPTDAGGFTCPLCASGGLAVLPANLWTADLPVWLPAPRRAALHSSLHPLQVLWPAATPRAPPAHS